MEKTDLERYKEACSYPGKIVPGEVKKHLSDYLKALRLDRKVVQIQAGWELEQYPALKKSVRNILVEASKKVSAMDARAARAARAAMDAMDARDALDAMVAMDARDARAARDAMDARAAMVAMDARDARAARAAMDARDALDARVARDARDARDAMVALDAMVAMDARDARAARDAMDAMDAMEAMDAGEARDEKSIKQFAIWCIQSGGWYWRWELSWIVTTYLGGIQFGKNDVLKWSKPLFEAFISGAWFLYWTADVLYWVAKPTVHVELISGRRRLHHDRYAALQSDVEDLYFWHGVLVPAFVVVKPEWITVKHIDSERNVEVRRVMIERYGSWRYLQDSGAELISEDARGSLYKKEIPDDEPLMILKVKNSTPEQDGSAKDYYLRVPPTMSTAEQAVAWTFGFEKVKDYDPLIET